MMNLRDLIGLRACPQCGHHCPDCGDARRPCWAGLCHYCAEPQHGEPCASCGLPQTDHECGMEPFPRPDVEGWLDPTSPWEPWFVEELRLADDRGGALDALIAVGLATRLSRYAAPKAASPAARCRAWMRDLSAEQQAEAERAVISAAASLERELAELEAGEPCDAAMAEWLSFARDELESALVALSHLGPTSSASLIAARIDEVAKQLAASWIGLGVDRTPRWEAVMADDPDAWWPVVQK